jgi:hypothetical protein
MKLTVPTGVCEMILFSSPWKWEYLHSQEFQIPVQYTVNHLDISQ